MIILKNKGEIDLEVITTMGVNVKECDSPIGYFGTGLKFAIATFLREGIEFFMYRGIHKYTFYAEPVTIRGKEFKKCYMSGPFDAIDLGFTTDLGRNWEIWQAYREIHSNCLDECGEIYEAEKLSSGSDGFTSFVIETPVDVVGTFLNKQSSKLLFSNEKIEIFEGRNSVIYYQGIRAKDLHKPSIYTYNILKKCQLTEDRLLCYDHQVSELISDTVSQMEDKEIIKDVVTAAHDSYESGIGPCFYSSPVPSKKFMETCNESLKKVNSQFKEHVEKNTPKAPRTKIEKKHDFMVNLRELCDQYDVNIAELNDYDGEYKELRGGILDVE